MPGAKKKKGGKRARRGKKTNDNDASKHIPLAEEGQEYARVTNLLGDARVAVVTTTGVERIAIIRGKFRKRVWINKNDIIVISNRGYQDDRVDVVHKYHPNEVKQLVRKGDVPRGLLSDDDKDDNQDAGGIAWAMPNSEDSEEEESGEFIEKGEKQPEKPKRREIAPQPVRPNLSDISDDDTSGSYSLEDL
jgi:translation initiation factor 1A